MDNIISAFMAYIVAVAVFVTTALLINSAEKTKNLWGGAVASAIILAINGHAWYIVIPFAIFGHITCCVLAPKDP